MHAQLELFFPSAKHLPPSFHPSHIFSSDEQNSPLFYYTATLSATTLLSEPFFTLCRSASTANTTLATQLLVRSLNTPLDHANTFSIHNTYWTFTLDKSSYEEFGMIGRLSDFTIRHHSHDALYIVTVDISDANKFQLGKKQYERLKWCVERCYDMHCQVVYVKGNTASDHAIRASVTR